MGKITHGSKTISKPYKVKDGPEYEIRLLTHVRDHSPYFQFQWRGKGNSHIDSGSTKVFTWGANTQHFTTNAGPMGNIVVERHYTGSHHDLSFTSGGHKHTWTLQATPGEDKKHYSSWYSTGVISEVKLFKITNNSNGKVLTIKPDIKYPKGSILTTVQMGASKLADFETGSKFHTNAGNVSINTQLFSSSGESGWRIFGGKFQVQIFTHWEDVVNRNWDIV